MPNQLSPDSDRMSVVVPKKLKEKMREIAKRDKRTLSQWVAIALEEQVENKTVKG